jgi:hypothetical protein
MELRLKLRKSSPTTRHREQALSRLSRHLIFHAGLSEIRSARELPCAMRARRVSGRGHHWQCR